MNIFDIHGSRPSSRFNRGTFPIHASLKGHFIYRDEKRNLHGIFCRCSPPSNETMTIAIPRRMSRGSVNATRGKRNYSFLMPPLSNCCERKVSALRSTYRKLRKRCKSLSNGQQSHLNAALPFPPPSPASAKLVSIKFETCLSGIMPPAGDLVT